MGVLLLGRRLAAEESGPRAERRKITLPGTCGRAAAQKNPKGHPSRATAACRVTEGGSHRPPLSPCPPPPKRLGDGVELCLHKKGAVEARAEGAVEVKAVEKHVRREVKLRDEGHAAADLFVRRRGVEDDV